MPIAAQKQAITTEEKFAKIQKIISNIRNPYDQAIIRDFILELCKRYQAKDKELQGYVSPSVKAMTAFDGEYIDRILKEFGLE